MRAMQLACALPRVLPRCCHAGAAHRPQQLLWRCFGIPTAISGAESWIGQFRVQDPRVSTRNCEPHATPAPRPQLWEKFRPGTPVPKELGPNRDYNIDLVPKFMMSNGLLVKVLLHTDVVKYLEFKAVDGSFVLNKGKIHKARQQ